MGTHNHQKLFAFFPPPEFASSALKKFNFCGGLYRQMGLYARKLHKQSSEKAKKLLSGHVKHSSSYQTFYYVRRARISYARA